jgi:phage-related minor tail protein
MDSKFLILQRTDIKQIVPRLTAGETKHDKEKFKLVGEKEKNEELAFWDMIEKAAKEIMSPQETEKFMTAVRKVS